MKALLIVLAMATFSYGQCPGGQCPAFSRAKAVVALPSVVAQRTVQRTAERSVQRRSYRRSVYRARVWRPFRLFRR